VLLDLRREAQHPHDLGDPGSGYPLAAGDGGLVGGLAGRQQGLPLDGLADPPAARAAAQRGQGSSTTRGVLGAWGGFGFPRRGGMTETTWSALDT
jgi:hypothetical protein